MKLLITLPLILISALSVLGSDVYVSFGSDTSPYYEFYSDSAGSIPLTSLETSKSYTFYRLYSAPTHPFYVSDVGYEQASSSKISLSGDGSPTTGITGTQNFTLSFNNFDPATDTLYFYCTSHSEMVGQFSFDAALPLVGTSDLFVDTSNATWTRVITLTLKADEQSGASQAGAAQSLLINATNVPEGSQYRIYRTTSNGGNYFSGGTDLTSGLNTISVAGVSFARTVKIQFNIAAGGLEFDSLSINGTSLYGEGGYNLVAPSGSVLASSVFSTGSGANPYVYTSALTSDGASSREEQTFSLNVTALPEGGANYTIYKTTANGADYVGPATPLQLGSNLIPVQAVEFDRTVKLRLTADVAIDEFIVNGEYIVGTSENAFTAPSGSVLASSVFSTGSGANPYVYTSALTSDGASSREEQTFTLNVTALPEGGANYTKYKTTNSDGAEYTSNPVALQLGLNSFSVTGGVSFDRTVKLQLSADVAIDKFIVNGEYIVGTASFEAPEGSVFISTQFSTGTNTYPLIYTLAETAEGVSSQAEQICILNVTALPDGGASYSVYKTNSNGQDIFGAATALVLGQNAIVVSAVDFDRTVRVRLTADVAIDSLNINGNYLVGSAPVPAPEGSVYASDSVFDPNSNNSSNSSWPYIYTAALASEGVSSQASFKFILNITELPEGGANYQIAKTTSNSQWYFSDPKALNLGVNKFTVPAVAFDRTVRLRLSSGAVAYEYFGVNGGDLYGTPLDTDNDGVNDYDDYAPNDPNVQVAPPAEAPALSVSTDGTDVTLVWTDSAGFEVKSSDDLTTWTSTGDAESPYTETIGSTKFFKLSND